MPPPEAAEPLPRIDGDELLDALPRGADVRRIVAQATPPLSAAAIARTFAGPEAKGFSPLCTLASSGANSGTIVVGEYGPHGVVAQKPFDLPPEEPVPRLGVQVHQHARGRRTATYARIGAPTRPRTHLTQLMRRLTADHANVMRVVALTAATDLVHHPTAYNARLYTPWYAGGSLWQDALGRFGVAGVRRILRGAADGLAFLNTQLGWMHADIKPGNVFVHLPPDGGGPVGVIGDLDDVFCVGECDPAVHVTSGTDFYGAAFSPSDVRRDLVALVVTGVECLVGEPWWAWCHARYRERYPRDHEARAKTVGYLPLDGGSHCEWDGALFTEYWRRAAAAGSTARVPADVGRLFRQLVAPGA